MDAIEKAVRERAHALSDHAGRPNGRSDEFWFAAKAELERKEVTDPRQLGAPVRQHREPPRHESAADWGMRECVTQWL
jgi:Protein of unknown function (DUF2934)